MTAWIAPQSIDHPIATVMETTNYEMFRTMVGNRDVTTLRKKRVEQSIQANGYIFNPIIVNENMEIVDGQARFEVLKEMNMPIHYVIWPGLGANQCAALNASTTLWTLMDYIKLYASQGLSQYQMLNDMMEKYLPLGISSREVIAACTGILDVRAAKIKSGAFSMTDEQAEMAVRKLDYWARFANVVKAAQKGAPYLMFQAVTFAYESGACDPERLYRSFMKYYQAEVTPTFVSVDGALKVLNAIYNRNNKTGKLIHLEVEYERFQADRNTWYLARYGKGYITSAEE